MKNLTLKDKKIKAFNTWARGKGYIGQWEFEKMKILVYHFDFDIKQVQKAIRTRDKKHILVYGG